MSFETSAENYTIGKGQVFFNRKQDNGTFEGWRNLGNVVSLSTSVEIEKLDHYTTRSKYRNKDKSVIVEVNPKLSMTLDEINAENFAFLFLADVQEIDQAASLTDETKTIASDDCRSHEKRGFYSVEEKYPFRPSSLAQASSASYHSLPK